MKYQLTKEELQRELAATVEALPLEPEQTLADSVKLEDERMVYRSEWVLPEGKTRRVRMSAGICTACGTKSFFPLLPATRCCGYSVTGFTVGEPARRVYHGDTLECPACGKVCTALHSSTFQSWTCIQESDRISIACVRGHLALLGWRFSKRAHHDGHVSFVFARMDGALFIDRRAFRVTGYQFGLNTVYFDRWQSRTRFEDHIGGIDSSLLAPFPRETVEESDCDRSGFYAYCRTKGKIYPVSYLLLWQKHPQVENLAVQGFGRYLSGVLGASIVTGGSYWHSCPSLCMSLVDRYLNWHEVKPARLLGLTKAELWMARECRPETLLFVREQGLRMNPDQLRLLDALGVWSFRALLKTDFHGYRVPLLRLLTYLLRQRKLHPELRALCDAHYIRDYWNMVIRIYGRMEPAVLYPRDLVASHDRFAAQIKDAEERGLNERIASQTVLWESLCFRDDRLGLMIFPARSQSDLVREGKELCHCVATYAKAVARGETSIFFIRHTDSPQIPFFTLEYCNGKVRQNRGYKNCPRTPEVTAFEAEWLEYIEKVKEKEKHGKRNCSKNTDCRARA